MYVINYPCPNIRWAMLANGALNNISRRTVLVIDVINFLDPIILFGHQRIV